MAVIDYRARLVCNKLEEKYKQHSFYYECDSKTAIFFDGSKPIFVIIVDVAKYGEVFPNARWNIISFEEYSKNIEEEFTYVKFDPDGDSILEMLRPFTRTF